MVRIIKGFLLAVAGASFLLLFLIRPQDQKEELASQNQKPPELPVPQVDPSADPEHQIRVLTQALEANPGHTPVLLQLARLESDKGSYRDAERHLKEILRTEPDNEDARLELGRVLFQLGDVQGASRETQALLKRNPENPDALYNMGAIYANTGDPVQAEAYWKRLIASDPNSESAKLARESLNRLPQQRR